MTGERQPEKRRKNVKGTPRGTTGILSALLGFMVVHD